MTNKPEFDLCVIGAGPAGIILTLEYARLNPSHKIALVEFGDEKNDNEDNELDKSITIENLVNHHPPSECTNKGFGGTSKTWGGRCVMYDPIDFVPRAIIGDTCTWTRKFYDESLPYKNIASGYFECGTSFFDMREKPGKIERLSDRFVDGVVTDQIVERWSMPTRFDARYKDEIYNNSNITRFFGFRAAEFSVEHETVHLLKIRDQAGVVKEVSATKFVLSAGAQESTRLLLSNPQIFQSLGDVPSSLGKYYQCHLSGKIASIKLYGDPGKTKYGFEQDPDGVFYRRRLQFTSEYLEKTNMLNIAFWLDNPLYFDPSHKSGPMSFMYLMMLVPVLRDKLAPPAIAQSITKGKQNSIGKHLMNVVKGLPSSLAVPTSIFYKRYLKKRKLPGVFLYNPKNIYALHFHAEQIPLEANQMRYEANTGQLIIDYTVSQKDADEVVRSHDELDKWLRTSGVGELVYWYPEQERSKIIRENSKDGIHQNGTTRIADSPGKGVVDTNLRVFGTRNLYVCSSSVFPTSGQANPTYYLGCLAAKLADHLTIEHKV
ncbi:MAG: GMC family oxidoreductase [Chitinophagaceae bacterium]|nr:MAG: GMC family oxidoreductase [Chitinophagaceae bacterium]